MSGHHEPATKLLGPLPTLNKHLLATCMIASVGGLLFGFDTAVIAGTVGGLTKAFDLSPLALGITVSSALWGTVLGAAFAGNLGDKIGRRACLRALGLLYVITAFGCAFAWGWYPLLFFRVLGGLAIGGSSVISPTYITEIAPPKVRGRLVGMFQFNVVVGMLLAYLSNYLVGHWHLGAADWRWKFGISAAPAIAFYLFLFFIAESPRWLVAKGRRAEALEILTRNGDPEPEVELAEIVKSMELEAGKKGENVFQWRYRFPIFLAISIGMFNQLSGINAILYYLNSIFEKAGFDRVSSDFQAVLIGVTNLVAVTLAMIGIDRMGRRMLLLIGSVGTSLCLFGVAEVFRRQQYQGALLWFLVGFIGFFSFSQGAVIWVYISEIFPNRVRAKGQSIGSFTHWFMNAVVSVIFPIVAARWGAVPFYFFAGIMALQFFVVLFLFPETRAVSLEAMEERVHS
jgi:SP family arabinose:H+ symporter-like MFS transporter